MTQLGTRFDRLITLLDTGSSLATRKAAASQIGEIQRQHPHFLQTLLTRVQPFLRSKSWDTRIAAGFAIEAISKNVPLWEPSRVQLQSGQGEEYFPPPLGFAKFDINQVLEHGAPLLASGGEEYEEDTSAMDPKERLAMQQKQLRQKLGLDVLGDGSSLMGDIVSEADLISEHEIKYKDESTRKPPEESKRKLSDMVYEIEGAQGISNREKNRLKRKARQELKDKEARRYTTLKEQVSLTPAPVPNTPLPRNNSNTSIQQQGGDLVRNHSTSSLFNCLDTPETKEFYSNPLQIRPISQQSSMQRDNSYDNLMGLARVSSSHDFDALRRNHSSSSLSEIESEPLFGDESLSLQSKRMKTVITEQPQAEHKIVLEHIPQTEPPSLEESYLVWPFESICQDLLHDLFQPNWEIRHGAAIGLREVLSIHATGAGKIAGVYTREAWTRQNDLWLEDCAIRLLCVFALDRFGDYVSDQVVSPVRETCAMALASILKHVKPLLGGQILHCLWRLYASKIWEVRHGGLLGLKYLVAIRRDIVNDNLEDILSHVTKGLLDEDDDVRAVSAETLLPIVDVIIQRSFGRLSTIISILWDALTELDELTASTASIMSLLSEFYSYGVISNMTNLVISEIDRDMILYSQDARHVLGASSEHQSVNLLIKFVPRLWPFLRHTITTVREAVLKTLNRLLSSSAESLMGWLPHILAQAMQHIFQNIFLETKPNLVEMTLNVWSLLVSSCPTHILVNQAQPSLHLWFQLFVTPPGTTIDEKLIMKNKPSEFSDDTAKKKRGRPRKEDTVEDTNEILGDNTSVGLTKEEIERSISNRIAGATALGTLGRFWDPQALHMFLPIIYTMLQSNWQTQRQAAALLISEWASMKFASMDPLDFSPHLLSQLIFMLEDENRIATCGEIERFLKRMRHECQVLLLSMESAITPEVMEMIGPFETMSCTSASKFAVELYPALVQRISQMPYRKQRGSKQDGDNPEEIRESRRRRLLATIGYIQSYEDTLEISTQASIASAVIALGKLPQKLNPIIKSLMGSIRKEENTKLQQRSAKSLAELIAMCSNRQVSPNDKIIKNICTYVSTNKSTTPQAASVENYIEGSKKSRSLTLDDEIPAPRPEGEEVLEGRIASRGASFVIESLCDIFEERVFMSLPKLWEYSTSAILTYARFYESPTPIEQLPEFTEMSQNLIDHMQVLQCVASKVSMRLSDEFLNILPCLFGYISYPNFAVQTMTAILISTITKRNTLPCMQQIIRCVLPMIGDASSIQSRLGSATVLHQIIHDIGISILPYIVFLIVPILGRMSDQNWKIRETVTGCFATLIKIMPLERGTSDPEGMDPVLLEQKKREREFLDQLLDSSKLQNYALPMKINTELRKYQQDGINWLAFLHKYKLHGILCDDMGLGKTLQSMCIMIGTNIERKIAHAANPTPENIPLPSLVVCPPTIVAHWYHEIKKFSEDTKVIQYNGPPAERQAIRAAIPGFDVVVMSYDIVRNDIESLQTIPFNYCILDEGHVIKNAKTKITKAVKMIQANHRLILTGTPIQNNVLELWSLFDFLMPGFLGSEKQFNETYSKPILMSRDAKATPKDQEAGTLAMEALHRQVLPFLLRRLKEDVLNDLPPKIIQDYYCDLCPLQVRLYEDFSISTQGKDGLDGLMTPKETTRNSHPFTDNESTQASSGGETGAGKKSGTHIFQALQYLRKLSNHPLLVLNEAHPEYRKVMTEVAQQNTNLHDLQYAPKLGALKQLLQDCGIGVDNTESELYPGAQPTTSQHRVLIFAQLKAMLDLIEDDLLRAHMPSVTYMRLDGTIESSRRHEIVTKFNEDPSIDLLLLTTHVGGLGLNLTGADTVIFVEHDWNPMKDLQAMDRAHRIGQKKVVNVYRLITRGTLEEKIMGLQKFKLNIANSVVNQENSSLRTMETEQVLDLFVLEKAEGQKSKRARAAQGNAGGNAAASSSSGGVGAPGIPSKLLENLQELWDESQYTEEYNVSKFVSRLKEDGAPQ